MRVGYYTTWVVLVAVFSAVVLSLAGIVGQDVVRAESRTVRVTDKMGDRTHHLSGAVMVPSGCHDLNSRVYQIDPQNFLLIFQTWEDPTRMCNTEEVARQFFLTVFAPNTGIAFQATYDGMLVPLEVTKMYK